MRNFVFRSSASLEIVLCAEAAFCALDRGDLVVEGLGFSNFLSWLWSESCDCESLLPFTAVPSSPALRSDERTCGSIVWVGESNSLPVLVWLSPLVELNLGFGSGLIESRFEDACDEAEVVLMGLTEPLGNPAVDCLGGRTLVEGAGGGPMEGRASRTLEAGGF